MTFRRFTTSWRHTNEDGADILYPAGWAGEMEAATAADADKAGVTVRQDGTAPETEKPKAK